MAIELQVEKMRLAEATSARDSAVQRLASAYDSIKEKAQTIARLQGEKAELETRLAFAENDAKEATGTTRSEEYRTMENEINRLQDLVRKLSESSVQVKSPISSPSSERNSRMELGSASTLFSAVDDTSPFLPSVDSSKSLVSKCATLRT